MANPLVWIYLLAFSAPLFVSFHGGNYLNLLTSWPNLFFVGFLGVVLLAPEVFYGTSMGQGNQWAVYSSEFLLTRAVDRNLLARSKSIALFLSALIVPTWMFFASLGHSNLRITALSKSEQQACLVSFPGSVLLKNKYGLTTCSFREGIFSWRPGMSGWFFWLL